jgi:hypothetical protein
MSLTTDDGFIVESRGGTMGDKGRKVYRWIVLALDETEALGLLNGEMPELDHKMVACGTDIRSQAARLGVEPGTYRQI